MDQANLRLPLGYSALAPLDRHKHAGLAVRPGLNQSWCARLNCVFLNAVELAKASADYPIGFVRDNANGEYQPVAVLSLRAEENLFVGEDGRWRPRTYVPAYIRRFPFCIAEVPAPGGAEPQRLICVQEDGLARSDSPYFDAAGEATAAWKPVKDLVEAIEASRQQTPAGSRPSACSPRSTRWPCRATAAASCACRACTASTRRSSTRWARAS